MGLIAEALCETLWPTRCALCDAAGRVLCEECAGRLDVLDRWRACPKCGAAFGLVQCDHCTPVVTQNQPQAFCISALRYTHATGVLIKTYKDKGEQRLAAVLADMLANAIDPSWAAWADCVTYITATRAARARRGFDHMELIANELSLKLGVACVCTLAAPKALDQRALSRMQRRQNMAGRFTVCRPVEGMKLILIDDVFTTGATMREASSALQSAGALTRCATIARA